MEVEQPPQSQAKLSEGDEQESVINALEERLEKHDNSRKTVQDKIHEICGRLRTQVDELEERINKELEEKFTLEDDRLQSALGGLRENRSAGALQKAKAELLVMQSYELTKNDEPDLDFAKMYELKTERRIVPELIETRKPTDVRVTGVSGGKISVGFTCLSPDEERVLSDHNIVDPVKYKCLISQKKGRKRSKEYSLYANEGDDFSSFTFTPDNIEPGISNGIRVKMVLGDGEGEWSDVAEFATPEFKGCCAWKKCPDEISGKKRYALDERNPRVATKVNDGYNTIIGNTHIPLNTVTLWNIKILKSKDNNGAGILIGVAPFDINQNDFDNYNYCGWYFYCYDSTLISGPPHYYGGKEYGPRKRPGQYVRTGDTVGVVMDTTNGELSSVLNGVNYGVAYERIPLDKPLVPCVLLILEGDSVEFDTSEVKENVDSSISVPSNITTNNVTWDSITLTWGEVSDASFYQIEVDGSISCCTSTANTFTKRELLPETEHSFRVRTVRGSSLSEWSDVVNGRTLKAPEFSECMWEKCPDDVVWSRKYNVDGRNPRISVKVGDSYCTIIGNTHIPLNTVTSWSIKILKSQWNSGRYIYIGIAPNDINQNNMDNYHECGWYFDCYRSILSSGPPHNYIAKAYGPRKDWGQYVHTGDSVGIVMDTAKGNLSFILDNVNHGAAYCGIPLDKPLVPCVILRYKEDSVELVT